MIRIDYSELPDAVKQHYPWPGELFTLPSGMKYHYLDEGPRDGQVILLVHGNPTWSFYYRTLVGPLVAAGYRVIVPDHIGCGLSDKPLDWDYRLAQHIDHLAALVAHLDLRNVTLGVHDWGGAIGFGAALRTPERFQRFVVFNTSVFVGRVPRSIKLVRVPGVGALLVRGFNGFVRGGLVRAISDKSRMKNGVATGYLAPYKDWNHRIATLRFVEDIPTKPSHPSWNTLQAVDAGLQTFADRPFMFVWGEKDFVFTTAFLDEFVKRLPHGEVHRLPECAHWIVEEAHERIAPWMTDFLQRNPLTGKAGSE